ncbi:MAG: hypothetical protein RIR88_770 [Actinomycetota bacterium]|jgi:hypothetical protein
MESSIRAQLKTMLESDKGSYRETARSLLGGDLSWSDSEIALLIDSFINEPYLTRND